MSERDIRESKDKTVVPSVDSIEDVEGSEKAAVATAVRQVKALEAFGIETAERLAKNAGDARVDDDVSAGLQAVQADALQAMISFAGQKFDSIGANAKLALETARTWAARQIEALRKARESYRRSQAADQIRDYKGNPGGLIRLFEKYYESHPYHEKKVAYSYDPFERSFLRAVENLTTDASAFHALSRLYRDVSKRKDFSRDLSIVIMSKFVEKNDGTETKILNGGGGQKPSEAVTLANAIYDFPDVYAASKQYYSGTFDPNLNSEMHGISKSYLRGIFNHLRSLGDVEAMATFSPSSFEAEDFEYVREALFRAYVEKRPQRILRELKSFGPLLNGMPTNERDRIVRAAIDAPGYPSVYDFYDLSISPIVSGENTEHLAEKLRLDGYEKADIAKMLWGDKLMVATLSPKLAKALEIPREDRDKMFEKVLIDDPAFLRDNADRIQLSEAQRIRVEKRIVEIETQAMSDDLSRQLQYAHYDIRNFAVEEFRRIASVDFKKARDLFFGESFVPTVENEPESGKFVLGADLELERRAEAIRLVSESPALRAIFLEITDQFSATALRAFAKRVKAVGIKSAESFFMGNKDEWDRNPESRWPLMEEFLIDAQEALARTKAEDPIEMGEMEDDGSVAVTLEIPSLRHDPSWYDESRVVSYPISTDDKDYRLPAEFALIENLQSHAPQDVRALYRAMVSGNRGAMRILVEKMSGLGEVPPEKFEFIALSLEAVARLWDASAPNEDAVVKDLREKLSSAENLIPLPGSSEPLTIHNQLLNRDRVIPSFTDSVRSGYLTEVALAYAVQLSRKPSVEITEVAKHLIVVETQARAMYKNVVEQGVPIFRDFVAWANEEHRKAGASYPGEFYVGRDTLMTLHEGANAMRWGKMSGKKRRSLTVHVDVSRPLQYNATANPELKAMMLTWLEQEGVTEKMLGIDGGKSGNSPKYVFNALSGRELPTDELDEKIRLVDTVISTRQFNSRMNYDGLVDWMEVLPKFSDRSEGIAKNEFGKYYVVTSRRSPIERTLAWTVQQAVWRELINYDAVAHAAANAIEPRGVSANDKTNKYPPLPYK